MMSMVERVARAIAGCQQELGEDKWRYCLPEARAAIEAMRGGGGEMTDAMYLTDGECIKTVFKAAIDAALNERVVG